MAPTRATNTSVKSKLSEDGKVILEMMEKQFVNMKEYFTNCLKESSDTANEMRSRLDDLMDQFSSFKHDILLDMESKLNDLTEVRNNYEKLASKVSKLEERVDDGDAYERRDCLIFSGDSLPQCEQGENCSDIIITLLKKVNLEIGRSDISTAHRLGSKKKQQGPDRRPIIVKLCRRDLKRDIRYACKQNKPNYYVNEDLTPSRSTILWALRMMKRKHSKIISGCNSEDGKVCVWIKSTSPSSRDVKRFLNTYEQLADFSMNILKENVSMFIDVWRH